MNYKIWGINPVGHRLSNIFLHIINAVLLFIIVSFILKDYIIAFLSSLFFAIHPINNEVVNMVSFNETQLSTIFFLLAFYFYQSSYQSSSDLIVPECKGSQEIERCYVDYAIQNKNPSICQDVSQESIRNSCYDQLASRLNREDLCRGWQQGKKGTTSCSDGEHQLLSGKDSA